MVRLIMTKFWPAFIPLALYIAWMLYRHAYAKKHGGDVPQWMRGRSWWWTLASCLVIAVLCFASLGVLAPANEGKHYRPTELRDGKLIKGGFQ